MTSTKMRLKSFAYRLWQMTLKCFWRLTGGRQEKCMGLSLNLHPDTVWPGRRGLQLPAEDCRAKIVSYTDLVQAHALCNAVINKHQPVIIDVGAYHGEYAILLGGLIKKHGGGRVIAIEPDEANVKILRNNIERNDLQDIIHVVESAVSDSSGAMEFVSNGIEGHLLSIVNGNNLDSYKVNVETLSDILAKFKINKVDFLLIDVEGSELPVLLGFPWDIIKPSMIFCELHPYNWPMFGYSGEDLIKFLEQQHYRCFDMYFHEHKIFEHPYYIGPCFFLPD